MNKRTRGILLLAAGFVMLFAAVALYWAYDDRDRLAGETSAALLQELEADPAPPAITEEVTITTPEGYELLGAVHIPALDISLPVLATWDEALLDAAPCRYSGSLTTGDLVIDYDKHQVLIHGENARLTANEYRIVSLLGKYAGKVLTYDFIIRELWGPKAKTDNQILRVNMANIRRKIEKDPSHPEYLFTEVGVGYRMREGD